MASAAKTSSDLSPEDCNKRSIVHGLLNHKLQKDRFDNIKLRMVLSL